MRPLHVYLAVYCALVLGALLSLWQSRALGQIPVLWTLLALGIAVLAGVVLVLASPRPPSQTPDA